MGLQLAKSAGPCLKLFILVTSETATMYQFIYGHLLTSICFALQAPKMSFFSCVLCVGHFHEKSVRFYAENTLYRYSFTNANLVFRAHECLKSHFLFLEKPLFKVNTR